MDLILCCGIDILCYVTYAPNYRLYNLTSTVVRTLTEIHTQDTNVHAKHAQGGIEHRRYLFTVGFTVTQPTCIQHGNLPVAEGRVRSQSVVRHRSTGWHPCTTGCSIHRMVVQPGISRVAIRVVSLVVVFLTV
jgi:hypothetical protein